MGIRETLNRNQTLTTGITIAVILVALIIIVMQLTGGGAGGATVYTKAFFSTNEDGSNWFVDDINKVPPFDHNGKPAYRVHLYTCDKGKTQFVGYLQRYTDAGKKKAEALRANPQAARDPAEFDALEFTEVEVKAPKDSKWIRRNDAKAEALMSAVKCPDGSTNNLEYYLPE